MKNEKKCSGIRMSWPWKGCPCGAAAKFQLAGLWYCGAHYAKAAEALTLLALIEEEKRGNKPLPQWALNALDDAIDWVDR